MKVFGSTRLYDAINLIMQGFGAIYLSFEESKLQIRSINWIAIQGKCAIDNP